MVNTELTGIVYCIKNTVNTKKYIGITTMSLQQRFNSHLKPSTVKQRGSYKLYNAINKYGRDKFYVEVVESNVRLEMLNPREVYWIEFYDSYNNGYNTTKGGDYVVIEPDEQPDEAMDILLSAMSKAMKKTKNILVCTPVEKLSDSGRKILVDTRVKVALIETGIKQTLKRPEFGLARRYEIEE